MQVLQSKSLVLFTMCLAVFIAQLDTSVVNLALNHIGASLDATVSQLQWVVDAYNLVYASFLLTAGILGDRFGHRATLLVGFALFGIGSLLCGMAPEAISLIAGRAITGFGAAFVIPASLAILSIAYSDHRERAHAIGVWASANSVAWLVGPAAGGLVVDYSGWRTIFLVIVPVSVLGCALGLYGVEESRSGGKRGLDPVGQILAVLALGAFSFGFIEAHHLGIESPLILSSFAVALISAVFFIVVETRVSDPLIPGFLFQQVRFPAALFGAATMTFSMYAAMFLLPIYLQSVLRDSAFLAGIHLLPMPIAFFFVSRASGKLAVSFGPRTMMVSGELALAAGMLLLVSLGARTDMLGLVTIEVAAACLGIGVGLNTGPAVSVAVASAPESHSGAASGILNTARVVGATFGVAILGAVFAAKAGQSASDPGAIAEGFRYAMLGGAMSVLLGAVTALLFIRKDALQRFAPVTSSSE